ncbi:hypothetical protein [Natronorubrum sp. FCH18a]|uniref:hypothetical protein n=1 Tax=Natronorubrum sp. FCH18a TaxID=3447018 RepID=UPI003F514DB8
MKWRCTWCGKPHESNDPPCDSCGHNEFEEAVVRQEEFETVDTGTQYMWVCANCGRQHMKNNPPCSRCGGHDLEKTEDAFSDVDRDLEVPSWLEVAKPYAPIIVGFALIVALFATGIVSPSIIPGIGTPSPPDAPGEGSEAAGIDLEAAEDEVHERLEAERNADESRSYDDGLAAYAEYTNRANVAMEYDDASPDSVDGSDFGVECRNELVGANLPIPGSIDDYDDEGALAEAVAEAVVTSERLTDPELESEGLDLHVGPDGALYGVYLTC